ncbi:MAG TPA: hypothetical protein H9902_06045 [Candidatus Stackebrandtia faecavium]|nr:hypothetical protein [Candidatus Stackebrandtia faecavium]
MDSECSGIQPEIAQRLIVLRERLRDFRSELSEGHVSPALWSGVVECGTEAAAIRKEAMRLLDQDPGSEYRREGAGYAIRIETDIWSFANAIAGLCLKQADARHESEG